MSAAEISGYVAAGLVFMTFYMKTMVPLRVIGICSNCAFITYGGLGALYPVLILHLILLPLNSLRLREMLSAVPKQLTPWKPGQSGNPKGREKGSRNKLAQRYFEDCYTLWQEGGIAALRTVMHNEPAKFCALIANGVPHQFRVDVDHTFAGLSPQELRDKLVEARARLLEAGVELGADDGALTLTAENAT